MIATVKNAKIRKQNSVEAPFEINSEKYNMGEIVDICSDIIATYLNLEEEQKCAYLEKMNDEFGYYDKYNNKGVYKYEEGVC